VPIADTDNVEIVYDKLMHLGGKLVTETVDNIIAGTVHPIPQEEMVTCEELRPAPKIFKETCRIDWTQGVKRCYDFVRGLSPYPAAWTEITTADKTIVLKVYETEKEFTTHTHPIGTLHTDNKSYLKVALADGFLHLRQIQLAGKKRMAVEDFLHGFKTNEDMKVN
jgi:methionyl-tRNA formyltransferase